MYSVQGVQTKPILKWRKRCSPLLTAAASSLLFVQICHNMRSSTAQGTVAYHPESTNKCTSHKFFSYFSVYCSSLLLTYWQPQQPDCSKFGTVAQKVPKPVTKSLSLSFQFLISIRQDYSISVFRLEYLHLKLIFTSSPLLFCRWELVATLHLGNWVGLTVNICVANGV